MKMSANLKHQKGFTLVEVIVVAVIIAALAAVAVPLYLNYVSNSRLNSATNAAGATASFLGACKNGGGTCADMDAANETATGPDTLTCAGGTGNNTNIVIPPNIRIIRGATDQVTGSFMEGANVVAGPSTAYSY